MSNTSKSRPSRRLPRFRLQTLLVLVTLFGVVLALIVDEWYPIYRQKQVAGIVLRRGGHVRWQDPLDAAGVVSGWLRFFLGDEYFAEVCDVGLRPRSDEDLDLLRVLPKMRRLSLSGTGVTDSTLARLNGSPQLESLQLDVGVLGERGLKR